MGGGWLSYKLENWVGSWSRDISWSVIRVSRNWEKAFWSSSFKRALPVVGTELAGISRFCRIDGSNSVLSGTGIGGTSSGTGIAKFGSKPKLNWKSFEHLVCCGVPMSSNHKQSFTFERYRFLQWRIAGVTGRVLKVGKRPVGSRVRRHRVYGRWRRSRCIPVMLLCKVHWDTNRGREDKSKKRGKGTRSLQAAPPHPCAHTFNVAPPRFIFTRKSVCASCATSDFPHTHTQRTHLPNTTINYSWVSIWINWGMTTRIMQN